AGPRPAAHVHAVADLLRHHRRHQALGQGQPGRRGRHAVVRAALVVGARGGQGIAAVSTPRLAPPSRRDLDAVARQLGRPPRGVTAVAHRCPCGLPDVVETAPRLPDGTPFPTLYYLTCPRAAAAVSRLEAAGVMREMTQRLAEDPELRADYQAAHERYVARRAAVARQEGMEPLPDGAASAGGMPD